MTIDLRLPQAAPPPYSRLVTGPVESLDDHEQVLVLGEIYIPELHGMDPVRDRSYRVTDVSLKRWAYQAGAVGAAWKDDKYRDLIERRIRHNLATELADRYVINLRATRALW